ncbi:MAG: hypothetical protein U0Q22_00100 [Acidimicrobiales bacterium]
MNGTTEDTTFEDRLLAVLLDEIDRPSLPASRPDAAGDVGRPRRLVLGLVGAAAAVALVVGAVSMRHDDGGVVRAAGDASSAGEASAAPYLMFGSPVGEVRRSAQPTPLAGPGLEFRRASAPGWVVGVSPGMVIAGSGLVEVGSVGERRLYSLPEESTGGTPFSVFFWQEADGSYWSVLAYRPGVDATTVQASDATASRREVDALLAALRYDHGSFEASAPFERFTSIDRAPRVWELTDDRTRLTAYATDAGLAGTGDVRTTVRGHDATYDGHTITWVERPGFVLRLTNTTRDRMLAPAAVAMTLEELRSVADSLVDSSATSYRTTPVFRGQLDERVVVRLPDGTPAAWVIAEDITGEGAEGFGSVRAPVGSDGVALDVRDGVVGFWVWAGTNDSSFGAGGHPSCATRVDVPPAGAPAVTVVLDPSCHD